LVGKQKTGEAERKEEGKNFKKIREKKEKRRAKTRTGKTCRILQSTNVT